MKPATSVIIPVHNREALVSGAVRSVLDQTVPPDEVIVVDDCSTDRTREVVAALAGEDRRVRLIRHTTNRGAGASRNTGVKAARCEWVAFLDSDDAWLPEKLERQYKRLEEWRAAMGESPAMVYCGYRNVFDEQSRPVTWSDAEGRNPWGVYRRFAASPCCLLMRRQVYLELGGMDPRMRTAQDLDFALRLAFRYPVAAMPDPLVVVDRMPRHRISSEGCSPWPFLRRWFIRGLLCGGPGATAMHLMHFARCNDVPRRRFRAAILAAGATALRPWCGGHWKGLLGILSRATGLKKAVNDTLVREELSTPGAK